MSWIVDLPLPYLAAVLGPVAVFALAIATIVIVIVEGWTDHRHDRRTLADLEEKRCLHIVERRRVR